MANQLSYKDSGVNYSQVDPIKILAQKTAAATAKNLKSFENTEVTASRGESAYVWEEEDSYRSLVIEGLGTKNLVADAVRTFSGKTHYDAIARDCIAMIVNDLIVVGAMPQVVNAYFAIGDARWMTDKARARDLITGWGKACDEIGATWGGGETPPLKNIIDPETIDLAGSAVGVVKPKKNLVLGDKLAAGDAIILIASSGIHSNGITLTREIAKKLPAGFRTKMSDGRTFGEAILTPTHLYVNFVRALLESNVVPHYMVNITGHGWRKLMRANQTFSYEIETVPQVDPLFEFIARHSGNDDEEMYGNYNMGAGFAVYLPQKDVDKVLKIAKEAGFKAWNAGQVVKGPKQVVIKPKNIIFSEKSLIVR